MKFKLDENLGRRGVVLLVNAGHNVHTTVDEGLGGAEDEALFAACQREQRVLITLDHDFGQTLRFPPESAAGIVILELPPRATPNSINLRLAEFLTLLASRPINQELWIVEPGRIRVHQRDNLDA